MRDYKYESKNLRSLSSDIQKTFEELNKPDKKKGVFRNVIEKIKKPMNGSAGILYRPEYTRKITIGKPKGLFSFLKFKKNKSQSFYPTVDSKRNMRREKISISGGRTFDRINAKAEKRNSARSDNNQNRGIAGAFTQMRAISGKTVRHRAFHISAALGSLIILFMSFVFIRSVIFPKEYMTDEVYSYSFLGDIKLQEYFDELEDPYAVVDTEEENIEPQFFFYNVEEGESIYSIAKEMGMTMDSLISFNSMDNAHLIRVDDRLLVPTVAGILYTVEEDDTLESVAEVYGVSMDDIKKANEMESDSLYAGEMVFLPGAQFTEKQRAEILGYFFYKPVHGRVSSTYGYRVHPITGVWKWHDGLDIAASWGTSVLAAKEGTVIYAGWNGGYGNCVKIKHQFGYTTVYGHLSSISVSVGEYVSAQEKIGAIGTTGFSTGPHLHFEVRKFGSSSNPASYEGLRYSGGYF